MKGKVKLQLYVYRNFFIIPLGKKAGWIHFGDEESVVMPSQVFIAGYYPSFFLQYSQSFV